MENKIISDEFVSKYKNKKVNWGFNGLGYVVYKRTYSRQKQDNNFEEWEETVQRCINGAQKIGADYTKEESERLFDYIFNLKCNFAGRSLWQLGTPHIERFGGNSLINCFYFSITKLEDFCSIFENLMMGSGVGFSVRREHIHELPRIKSNVKIGHESTKDAEFIVPDSRFGWIELLRKTLNSYFYTGVGFNYSTILVRGYGEPIKSFGGTASGPQILIEGITNICKVLQSRENKKLRSIDVLDIVNIIGSIVVAGNVRRSSQIALGDADDHLFIHAKRWDLGNIPTWRAMSNNTIVADDFTYLSDKLWEGYSGNGEPYGLFNLPLCQRTGRLGEKIKDNIDGMNPCVAPETLILTRNGEFPIKDLENQEVEVWNGKQWSKTKVVKTGTNKKLLEVWLEKEELDFDELQRLDVTLYHKFYLNDGSIKEAKDLVVGDKLLKFIDPIKVYDDDNGERTFLVVSIKDKNRVDDTYCCNEPLEHKVVFNGVLTGQCGEIGLESGESCNLAELYLNNIESKKELIDCAKLLYKTQKAICALNYLHKETNETVHRNFRLGLGVTGVCQSLDKLEWLDDCYNQLREFDKDWSKKHNWPISIKLTTLKPSGTLSLLSGSSPGIHSAYSKYYIRRVRMAADDKLVNYCKELGYKTEFETKFDNSVNRNTIIVEFPCYAGENVILAKDMSAVRQLDLVKQLQTIWADNSVSCTVYYSKEELPEIKSWLKKNYEDSIKSVSFLLHSEHGFKQPPYEEITEEKYKELKQNIKPIKRFDVNGGILLDSLECSSGLCPIK